MTTIERQHGVAGKVVLITGASSGIGEATARYLAAAGARVVLGARRTGRLDTLVAQITAAGGHAVHPTAAVYSATKFAVNALSEGLRLECGEAIRVTIISPGVTESELAESISDDQTREAIRAFRAGAIPAEAIARAIAYAVSQPADVDVSEVIVRPTSSPH